MPILPTMNWSSIVLLILIGLVSLHGEKNEAEENEFGDNTPRMVELSPFKVQETYQETIAKQVFCTKMS